MDTSTRTVPVPSPSLCNSLALSLSLNHHQLRWRTRYRPHQFSRSMATRSCLISQMEYSWYRPHKRSSLVARSRLTTLRCPLPAVLRLCPRRLPPRDRPKVKRVRSQPTRAVTRRVVIAFTYSVNRAQLTQYSPSVTHLRPHYALMLVFSAACVLCAIVFDAARSSLQSAARHPPGHDNNEDVNEDHERLCCRPAGSANTALHHALHTSAHCHTTRPPDIGRLPSTYRVNVTVTDKITREAALLMRKSKRRTLSARDIKYAVLLHLPGELSKHAMAEGMKALNKTSTSWGRSDGRWKHPSA